MSSSLALAFDFFLSDLGFDAFDVSLAFFSVVGAFGVLILSFVVFGVFAGYQCRLAGD
jgi:hypothetical protein